ncbi:MAG TPA: CPBP family intramembrane glutamic endopeptidase [Candidatus Limnocylindrales bacterium]|nr:CPBP family intramembrane glutamic endopeptidase [Candidatus Limnocylindrales bacterium]
MTTIRRRLIGPVRSMISGHPIASYVAIAAASSWALTGLLSVSILFGLLALFGPTVGAIVVSWADGSLVELRHRITDWRAAPGLYALAVGVPFAVAATAAALWMVAGHPAPGIGSIGAIEILIFVLVIGEEIGWRGFLLPRLRASLSLPAAGLVTGIVWSLWHLPIYLQPGQGLAAFAVFAWWVVPFAVVMGFVAERARFSVLVATVMHGSANIAIPILLPGVDRTWTMLAAGTVYLFVAVTLIVRSRSVSRSPRHSAARLHTKEIAA